VTGSFGRNVSGVMVGKAHALSNAGEDPPAAALAGPLRRLPLRCDQFVLVMSEPRCEGQSALEHSGCAKEVVSVLTRCKAGACLSLNPEIFGNGPASLPPLTADTLTESPPPTLLAVSDAVSSFSSSSSFRFRFVCPAFLFEPRPGALTAPPSSHSPGRVASGVMEVRLVAEALGEDAEPFALASVLLPATAASCLILIRGSVRGGPDAGTAADGVDADAGGEEADAAGVGPLALVAFGIAACFASWFAALFVDALAPASAAAEVARAA
jgi:hypothetical protein